MKDRGKATETYNGDYFSDYYSSSDLACRKHPSSSPIGICAFCLKDRLIKLVCSDCGEQRLSSCSCSSEISSNRNSCSVEVGSVGRVSFLIENERSESNSKPEGKAEKVFLLERSSSTHVETRRSGLWRFGRMFRKKRDDGNFDEKNGLWVFDYLGRVSRSRSLCSFRGAGLIGSEDGGGDHMSVSDARNSSVNGGLGFDSGKKSGFSESETRKSGLSEAETRKSGLSEAEPRRSGFESEGDFVTGFNGRNKRVYKLKESDFNELDDSSFIDLKVDLSSQSKPEFPALKMRDLSASELDSGLGKSLRGGSFHECGGSFRSMVGDGVYSNGSSCRITLNDRGIKKSRKSLKVWRWIFKQSPSCRSTAKKDENQILKT